MHCHVVCKSSFYTDLTRYARLCICISESQIVHTADASNFLRIINWRLTENNMEIILWASSKHADINTGQICRECSNLHRRVLKAI